MNTNNPNTPPLSDEERQALAACEAQITLYQASQLDAGRALAEINAGRLYRQTHPTFEDYCEERWDFAGRRAYHLIEAARLVDALADEGVVDLPSCEAHARPLVPLSGADRKAVWEAVLAERGAGGVTKAAVEAAASQLRAARQEALAEDGTEELPAVSPELREAMERAGTAYGASSEGAYSEGMDPGLALPVVEPDEHGSLVVSVPRTRYRGAAPDKPYVLVPSEHLDRELDREFIRELRDELERLGYRSVFNRTTDSVDWAAWTWNPLTGCRHGCEFCYAREIAGRYYPQGFRPTFHPGRLSAPGNTKLPAALEGAPGGRHVFVCSMGDLFGRWVPSAVVEAVLEEVRAHPDWVFIFLTKFPRRLREFDFPVNSWVGASVVDQAAVPHTERAFERVKAAVRWVSCEPLEGPVVFSRPELFDLFVIGARSRANGLPAFQPEAAWVDALRVQARSVGAAVYEKENLRTLLKEFPSPDPSRLAAPAATRDREPVRRGDGEAAPTSGRAVPVRTP